MNNNKLQWLKYNGFNNEKNTYIVTGETYSIKDKLKQAGFLYHPILGWHKASFDSAYQDRLIKIHADQILTLTAWGEPFFFPNVKEIIDAAAPVEDTLNWVGTIGKPLPAVKVKYISKSQYNSKYGLQYIYHFIDENNNELVWFSTIMLKKSIGDEFTIAARIKDHKLYKNKKQTIISRVKIIENFS